MITQELSSGTLVNNRYQVQCQLGEGGFGRTYLAKDIQRYNELCTIKEFAPNSQNIAQFQKCWELFQREAETLYKLDHPQIPKFLTKFDENGRHFVIQEYIEGNTYENLLQQKQQKQQQFSEQEVIKLLKELLPVLQYIHDQNLFHRDISPDNIIQPKDATKPAVLIDFGVVGYLEGSTSVGKMGYAPPEQMGGGQCLPSSDIYSLAVTAIELLTGKTPDLLFDSNYLRWKWQKYTTVSNTLANILNKMLETRPGNRYSSAMEVLNAINSLNNDSGFMNKLLTGIGTGVFLVAATMISGYIPIICNGLNNCHSDKKKNDIEIITDQKPTPSSQSPEKPVVSPNPTTLSSCEEDPNKCEKPNPKTLDTPTPKESIDNKQKPIKRNVKKMPDIKINTTKKIPSCDDVYFGNCLEGDKLRNKKNTEKDKQIVNTNSSSKSNNKSPINDTKDKTKSKKLPSCKDVFFGECSE